jgi:hypothetical protein
MKRKLKWISLVLAVVLLGFGAAILLWPRDRITVEIVGEDSNWNDIPRG